MDKLRTVVVVVLLLGVFFRFHHLDLKVYWFDEAITSHMLSGHHSWDVKQELQGRVIGIGEFMNYLRPSESFQDVAAVLIGEDGGQPLPYYVMAWLWLRLWGLWDGDTVVALRSLSAAFGFVALPLMYWLCMELFGSKRIALTAVILLAVSPFHVVYSQEARSYSLWVAVVLLSGVCLLQAVRVKTFAVWSAYSLVMALCFYVHFYSVLVAAGHGAYLVLTRERLRGYALAMACAFLLFSPWLYVVASHWDVVSQTTAWTAVRTTKEHLVAGFSCGLASLFLDYNFGARYPLFLAVPLVFAALAFIFHSVRRFSLDANRNQICFVFALMAACGLSIIGQDLLFGGLRSTVPRYMVPLYLGVQICAAHYLAERRRLLAAVLAIGLLSCALYSQSQVWWNKDMDEGLPHAAAAINLSERPLIVTDGNLGYLWSLGYLLTPKAIVLIADGNDTVPGGYSEVFLYKASKEMGVRVEGRYRLVKVDGCKDLWRVH